MQQTCNGSINEILSLFIGPLMHVIVSMVNSSSQSLSEIDAVHLVQCIIALSFYWVTPSNFFTNHTVFPLSSQLDFTTFQKVVLAYNRNQQSMNEGFKIILDHPFSEDQTIHEGEDAMVQVNRN